MNMADIAELQATLDHGFRSDGGSLVAIFVRPRAEAREELHEVRVTRADGVVGDRWSGDRVDTQITLINSSLLDRFAGHDRSHWQLCGDQLVVDMDLGEANAPVGQRIQLGDAVLEFTAAPHTGCSKFAARFGKEALAFISTPERAELRLRGAYVKVVEEGVVRVGDRVTKLAAGPPV